MAPHELFLPILSFLSIRQIRESPLDDEYLSLYLGLVRLTEKRQEILKALVDKPELTTTQFYQLLPDTTPAAQRSTRSVLLRLAKIHKLVTRRRFVKETDPVRECIHTEFLYTLTAKGLEYARERGYDPKSVAFVPESRNDDILRHQKVIADVHLAISRIRNDIFWSQHHLKDTVHIPGAGFIHVAPDAMTYINERYGLWEMECSKNGKYKDGESGKDRKVWRYVHYLDRAHKAWLSKYPNATNGMFVFWVELTAERRDNFIERIRQTYPYRIFRVAALDDLLADPFGKVWRTPADKHPFSF